MNPVMTRKLNSFAKVVILIFALLLLMMIFFSIYNRNTVQVIKSEIETANVNNLLFLKNQIEEKINQISISAITMANDPSIQELQYAKQSGNQYDFLKQRRLILEHISLQSGITGWLTEITVYSRLTGDVISTSSNPFGFVEEVLSGAIPKGWIYEGEPDNARLTWYAVTPMNAYERPETAKTIVRTSFHIALLQNMLDQYKRNGQGDPLLYHEKHGIIANRTIDPSLAGEMRTYLESNSLSQQPVNLSVRLSDQQYMVSYAAIGGTGWFIVDTIPMENILSPVTKARNTFYMFSLVLLGFGVLASYILYQQLQVPIRELIRQMQGIKRGNYSSRILMDGTGEFDFLYKRFNEMAEEIQLLLEKVYEEKIRSREALLKQLQSQINPHFLYNCLFFIKNMARLGDEEAVVAMTLNLGEYFRYTTRLGKQTARLQEELDVLVNYLEIQNLRTNRIHYRMDVPASLHDKEIPRLILQPVVENAVIHGIEPKEGQGHIIIRGLEEEHGFRIVIEDDGTGMDLAKIQDLQSRVERGENTDNASYGLWNVHQRMKLMFGDASGLTIRRGVDGGTVVVMRFCAKGEPDVSDLNR